MAKDQKDKKTYLMTRLLEIDKEIVNASYSGSRIMPSIDEEKLNILSIDIYGLKSEEIHNLKKHIVELFEARNKTVISHLENEKASIEKELKSIL